MEKTKELLKKADVSNQALLDHLKGTLTTVPATSQKTATTAPSNNAKCAGDMQNHAEIIGTLDCYSAKIDEDNNPENCLDNLSNGKIWVCQPNGYGGKCINFQSEPVLARRASVVRSDKYLNDKQACQGVVTKAAVAHPHTAGKDIGVLALKRVKCHDGEIPTCEVFKTAVCFKADKIMFKSNTEQNATDTELSNFAKYVRDNAWIDAGTANATVNASWMCTGEDATLAQGWIKAF